MSAERLATVGIMRDRVEGVRGPANAAHLDQITFKPIGDETAKLQALQSGAIDLAETISPADVQTAESSGFTIINRGQSCNIGYLGLNQSLYSASGGAPTPTIYANKDVRLAVAYALNKQSYLTALFSGLGQIPQSFVPAATEGFKAENLPGYDPAKAKQYLQQANLSPSQLNIDLYYPSNVVRPYMPDPKTEAQAIAGDLQAIGSTVNLKTEDWHSGYYADITSGRLPMFLIGWNCDWAGADNFLVTAEFGYTGGQPARQFGYQNDQMNELFNEAVRAPTAAQANQYWGQAQDLIAQDMPMVPLVNSNPPGAYSAKVHGFVPAGSGYFFYNSVWIE